MVGRLPASVASGERVISASSSVAWACSHSERSGRPDQASSTPRCRASRAPASRLSLPLASGRSPEKGLTISNRATLNSPPEGSTCLKPASAWRLRSAGSTAPALLKSEGRLGTASDSTPVPADT